MMKWHRRTALRREKKGTGIRWGAGWVLVCCLLVFCGRTALAHSAPARLQRLLGAQDACVLAAPDGRFLVSIHAQRPLIPASTLKILTALTAFHYLGEGYHFKTDFFLDAAGDLKIKGYGDPLLISEVLPRIVGALRHRLGPRPPVLKDLILDTSFFSPTLSIPGVSESFQPYDAPNGALCANFNTVSFQRLADGSFASGEPQTPLLPSVIPRIRKAHEPKGRILLTDNKNEAALYMGNLFAYFLKQAGIPITGKVRLGAVDPKTDKRLLSYRSPFSLDDTVTKLLAFSNNFIANQLLITCGAKAFGAPGTLAKGVRAALRYANGQLEIKGIKLVEGSGISRENHISAHTLYRLVKRFAPHHRLMRQTKRSYYKTGTLDGISNRVGFFKGADHRLYPFVVLLNGSPAAMDRVLDTLYAVVLAQP